MDFLKQLIAEHFVLLFVASLVMVAIGLLLALKLFHELRTDAKATRKALLQELYFFAKLRQMFSKNPPAVIIAPDEVNPLAETQVPFKAVPPPRTSGEKKP